MLFSSMDGEMNDSQMREDGTKNENEEKIEENPEGFTVHLFPSFSST